MKLDTIQTSFVNGEIAPALFGRTDVAQYQSACETVENFMLRPYGSLISAPGTEYVNACKTGGSTSISRLIKFIFSRTDAYAIEVGVGYFRFFNNGAVVVSSGTTPYEVSHTYSASELFDIQYSQVNDVIYLVHPNHPPRTLTRYASNNWTLSQFGFVGGPYLPDNVIYSNSTTSILSSATITPSATAGSITLSASANIFIPSSSTTGHINTFWKINTTVTNSTTGLSEQGYVKITAVTNPSTATATVIKTLKATTATNIWAQGAWSAVVGWPSRVTFHEQRLAMARTSFQPQNVWMSKTYEFENFAVDSAADDDALDLRLLSTEANDIKWLASADSLVAGTYNGDFVIGTGDGSPLTPTSVSVKKQNSWGSEAIPPVRIGNFFYYVQRYGKKLRELFYFWDLNSYKSVDRTILAPHIAGDGFIAIDYQQNPDTVLWAVCSQGTIATMTREVDQEVQGWTRLITDGYYESLVSIPSYSGDYDEIWVIVKRNINGTDRRYVERFKSQIIPDRQDKCFYVHSGLSYDAFERTSSTYTATTLGLTATAGTVVAVASSSKFSAGSVGKRIRAIDTDGNITGELTITGYTSATIVVGSVKYPFASTSSSAGYWGISIGSVSGLNHLENEEVVVLGDGGNDRPAKTVSNGSITLAYDYFIVTAGLTYTQKIKTLPQEAASQRGTAQGKKQRINEIALRVNRSYRGFYVGGEDETLDNQSYAENISSSTIFVGSINNPDFTLQRVIFRDPTTLLGTPEVLYSGIIPNISFRGNYEYGAQVILQNEDPLPIELQSIITTLDTNDK